MCVNLLFKKKKRARPKITRKCELLHVKTRPGFSRGSGQAWGQCQAQKDIFSIVFVQVKTIKVFCIQTRQMKSFYLFDLVYTKPKIYYYYLELFSQG